MTTPTYLYKIVPASSPVPSDLPERLPASSLDEKDQFIHLSTAKQVLRTLNNYFANDSSVFLLRLVYTNVEKEIRWEDPKGIQPGDIGAENVFAHLYNGLKLGKDEIEEVHTVEKSGDSWDAVIAQAKEDWLLY